MKKTLMEILHTINTYKLIRYLNKVFPNQSLEPNEVMNSTSKKQGDGIST